MSRVIAFLSDFGLDDTYVGQVKGVLAARAPGSTVIDLSHAVEPYAIDQGAWLLETSLGALPDDAVVLAVVDPGVGTARRGIAIVAGGRSFVGPDNGLLSAVLPGSMRAAGAVEVPWGMQAYELRAGQLFRERVAPTFHGRDVFGPVAAYLANGGDPAALGPRLESVTSLPRFAPDAEGWARIVHIDRYGNLVTTIPGDAFPSGAGLIVGEQTLRQTARTFGEVAPGELLIHRDSSGFVAVAANQGNAARLLGVQRGARVLLVRP